MYYNKFYQSELLAALQWAAFKKLSLVRCYSSHRVGYNQ